ncbi:uncharacterized protein [Asterias amurensis]|uniref:uncharacterized protein isoform X2 n=1 Tax=Asterias amurensis TaxID=7602 RepID=UPI003AB62381
MPSWQQPISLSEIVTFVSKMADKISDPPDGIIVRNKMECGICKKRLKTPKVLQCLHNFCENCLVYQGSFCVWSGSWSITCPLCKQTTKTPGCGVQNLETNFHLIGQLEDALVKEELLTEEFSQPACDLCDLEKGAMSRCLDCCMYMCLTCKTAHRRIAALSKHTVASLDELCLGEVTKTFRREKRTEECPNDHRFFCETCNDVVCKDCPEIDLRSVRSISPGWRGASQHKFVKIESAASSKRNITKQMITSLQKALGDYRSTLETIAADRANLERQSLGLREQVREAVRIIRKNIKEEKARLFKEIADIQQRKKKTLQECEKNLKAAMQRMSDSLEMAIDATDTASDQDFLGLVSLINNNLKDLMSNRPNAIYSGLPWWWLNRENSGHIGSLKHPNGRSYSDFVHGELFGSVQQRVGFKVSSAETTKKLTRVPVQPRLPSKYLPKPTVSATTKSFTTSPPEVPKFTFTKPSQLSFSFGQTTTLVKKHHGNISQPVFASKKEEDDDVIFISEKLPTADQRARAERLLLPPTFYLYEDDPPCPGCRGCEEEDLAERGIKLSSTETTKKLTRVPVQPRLPSKYLPKPATVSATTKPFITSPPEVPKFTSTKPSQLLFSFGQTTTLAKKHHRKIRSSRRHGNISQPVFASKKEEDDDVIFISEKLPTTDQRARAERLLLPPTFYLYEDDPPCPGCRGCEEEDLAERGIKLSGAKGFAFAKAGAQLFGSGGDNYAGGDKKQDSNYDPIIPKPTTEELIAKYQPKPGSWQCDCCWLNNEETALTCISCTAPKPGAATPLATQQLSTLPKLSGASRQNDSLPSSGISGAKGFAFAKAGAQLFGSGGDNYAGGDKKQDPNYDPIIPKLVDTTTGEEDEEIMYKQRARLYRYAKELNVWKERGIGEVKLMRHKDNGGLRLLMRPEKVLKECANHRITDDIKLESLKSSDRTWVWHALDYSEDEPCHEQFAIKFKTPELAVEFKQRFEELRAKRKREQTIEELIAKYQPKAGSWQCGGCWLHNKETAMTCISCKAPKPVALTPSGTQQLSTLSKLAGASQQKESLPSSGNKFKFGSVRGFSLAGMQTSDRSSKPAEFGAFGQLSTFLKTPSDKPKDQQKEVPPTKKGTGFAFGAAGDLSAQTPKSNGFRSFGQPSTFSKNPSDTGLFGGGPSTSSDTMAPKEKQVATPTSNFTFGSEFQKNDLGADGDQPNQPVVQSKLPSGGFTFCATNITPPKSEPVAADPSTAAPTTATPSTAVSSTAAPSTAAPSKSQPQPLTPVKPKDQQKEVPPTEEGIGFVFGGPSTSSDTVLMAPKEKQDATPTSKFTFGSGFQKYDLVAAGDQPNQPVVQSKSPSDGFTVGTMNLTSPKTEPVAAAHSTAAPTTATPSTAVSSTAAPSTAAPSKSQPQPLTPVKPKDQQKEVPPTEEGIGFVFGGPSTSSDTVLMAPKEKQDATPTSKFTFGSGFQKYDLVAAGDQPNQPVVQSKSPSDGFTVGTMNLTSPKTEPVAAAHSTAAPTTATPSTAVSSTAAPSTAAPSKSQPQPLTPVKPKDQQKEVPPTKEGIGFVFGGPSTSSDTVLMAPTEKQVATPTSKFTFGSGFQKNDLGADGDQPNQPVVQSKLPSGGFTFCATNITPPKSEPVAADPSTAAPTTATPSTAVSSTAAPSTAAPSKSQPQPLTPVKPKDQQKEVPPTEEGIGFVFGGPSTSSDTVLMAPKEKQDATPTSKFTFGSGFQKYDLVAAGDQPNQPVVQSKSPSDGFTVGTMNLTSPKTEPVAAAHSTAAPTTATPSTAVSSTAAPSTAAPSKSQPQPLTPVKPKDQQKEVPPTKEGIGFVFGGPSTSSDTVLMAPKEKQDATPTSKFTFGSGFQKYDLVAAGDQPNQPVVQSKSPSDGFTVGTMNLTSPKTEPVAAAHSTAAPTTATPSTAVSSTAAPSTAAPSKSQPQPLTPVKPKDQQKEVPPTKEGIGFVFGGPSTSSDTVLMAPTEKQVATPTSKFTFGSGFQKNDLGADGDQPNQPVVQSKLPSGGFTFCATNITPPKSEPVAADPSTAAPTTATPSTAVSSTAAPSTAAPSKSQPQPLTPVKPKDQQKEVPPTEEGIGFVFGGPSTSSDTVLMAPKEKQDATPTSKFTFGSGFQKYDLVAAGDQPNQPVVQSKSPSDGFTVGTMNLTSPKTEPVAAAHSTAAPTTATLSTAVSSTAAPSTAAPSKSQPQPLTPVKPKDQQKEVPPTEEGIGFVFGGPSTSSDTVLMAPTEKQVATPTSKFTFGSGFQKNDLGADGDQPNQPVVQSKLPSGGFTFCATNITPPKSEPVAADPSTAAPTTATPSTAVSSTAAPSTAAPSKSQPQPLTPVKPKDQQKEVPPTEEGIGFVFGGPSTSSDTVLMAPKEKQDATPTSKFTFGSGFQKYDLVAAGDQPNQPVVQSKSPSDGFTVGTMNLTSPKTEPVAAAHSTAAPTTATPSTAVSSTAAPSTAAPSKSQPQPLTPVKPKDQQKEVPPTKEGIGFVFGGPSTSSDTVLMAPKEKQDATPTSKFTFGSGFQKYDLVAAGDQPNQPVVQSKSPSDGFTVGTMNLTSPKTEPVAAAHSTAAPTTATPSTAVSSTAAPSTAAPSKSQPQPLTPVKPKDQQKEVPPTKEGIGFVFGGPSTSSDTVLMAPTEKQVATPTSKFTFGSGFQKNDLGADGDQPNQPVVQSKLPSGGFTFCATNITPPKSEPVAADPSTAAPTTATPSTAVSSTAAPSTAAPSKSQPQPLTPVKPKDQQKEVPPTEEGIGFVFGGPSTSSDTVLMAPKEKQDATPTSKFTFGSGFQKYDLVAAGDQPNQPVVQSKSPSDGFTVGTMNLTSPKTEPVAAAHSTAAPTTATPSTAVSSTAAPSTAAPSKSQPQPLTPVKPKDQQKEVPPTKEGIGFVFGGPSTSSDTVLMAPKEKQDATPTSKFTFGSGFQKYDLVAAGDQPNQPVVQSKSPSDGFTVGTMNLTSPKTEPVAAAHSTAAPTTATPSTAVSSTAAPSTAAPSKSQPQPLTPVKPKDQQKEVPPTKEGIGFVFGGPSTSSDTVLMAPTEKQVATPTSKFTFGSGFQKYDLVAAGDQPNQPVVQSKSPNDGFTVGTMNLTSPKTEPVAAAPSTAAPTTATPSTAVPSTAAHATAAPPIAAPSKSQIHTGSAFGAVSLSSQTPKSSAPPALSMHSEEKSMGFNFADMAKTKGSLFSFRMDVSKTQQEAPEKSTVKPKSPEDGDPFIELPECMEVRTGEEGEEVRFSHRAKLFRYNKESTQWKERGIGDIKVLSNPDTKKYRIVMRREQVLKVCANHFVTPDLKLQSMAGSTKSLAWMAMDASEDEVHMEQLAVRFRTEKLAQQFKEAVEAAQEDMKTGGGDAVKIKDGDNKEDKTEKAENEDPNVDGDVKEDDDEDDDGVDEGEEDEGANGDEEKEQDAMEQVDEKDEDEQNKPTQGGEERDAATQGDDKSPTFKSCDPNISKSFSELLCNANASHAQKQKEMSEAESSSKDEEAAGSSIDDSVTEERDDIHFDPIVQLPEQVCANHYITKDMALLPNAGSENSLVWRAMDASDGEPQPEQLAVRFKLAGTTQRFKVTFEECQAELRKLEDDSKGTEQETMEENTASIRTAVTDAATTTAATELSPRSATTITTCTAATEASTALTTTTAATSSLHQQ